MARLCVCVFARGQVNVRRGRRKTLFVRPVSLEKAHKFFVILKKFLRKLLSLSSPQLWLQDHLHTNFKKSPLVSFKFYMDVSFKKTAEIWNVYSFLLHLECYKNPSMLPLLQTDINIKLDVIQEPWITQQVLTLERERGSSNGSWCCSINYKVHREI